MKLVRIFLKSIFYIFLIPISYLLISLILSYIPISETSGETSKVKHIFLTTNGVHLDIVMPKEYMSSELQKDLITRQSNRYFAFGWGEENFYINTPTWGDLTFSTAFTAAFLDNKTLIHVTRYNSKREKWIKVPITEIQLKKLNTFLIETFTYSENGKKMRIPTKGYTSNRDDFYRARGKYAFYKTCNSWVNTGLKQSDLKGSLWTPFDFGVLHHYKD